MHWVLGPEIIYMHDILTAIHIVIVVIGHHQLFMSINGIVPSFNSPNLRPHDSSTAQRRIGSVPVCWIYIIEKVAAKAAYVHISSI